MVRPVGRGCYIFGVRYVNIDFLCEVCLCIVYGHLVC